MQTAVHDVLHSLYPDVYNGSVFVIVAGLEQRIRDDHFSERLEEDRQRIDHLKRGTHLLLVGMVSWLGAISIVSVIVFIIAYKYLGRDEDDDDVTTHDAESAKSAKKLGKKRGKKNGKKQLKVSVVDLSAALETQHAADVHHVKPSDDVVVGSSPHVVPELTTIDLDSCLTASRS